MNELKKLPKAISEGKGILAADKALQLVPKDLKVLVLKVLN